MKRDADSENLLETDIELCWVIALRSEAKSVIDAFNMSIVSNELLFPVYVNADKGHALVISGKGSAKSAAGATYLKSFLNVRSYAAWINFGIAGYFKEPTGKLYQALKVQNHDNGKAYFPGLRFSEFVDGSALSTVSKPEHLFPNQVLYDMEAAGFCELAPTFSCNELTYVFKVVSDTPSTPDSLVTKSMATKLIEKNIGTMSKLVGAIGELVKDEKNRLAIPPEVNHYLEKFHFTESNRVKFHQVYKKWQSTFPNKTLDALNCKLNTARELITRLEKDLLDEVKDWNLE